jgi:AcrR family transcriptional regulator
MGQWTPEKNKTKINQSASTKVIKHMNMESAEIITNPAYQKWINAGYQQFALEGLDGILVERIARILNLNKSGFYYYFGDRDFYLEQLLKFHLTQCKGVALEMRMMTRFDPDFFTTIMKHKFSVMVQMQLLRFRHHDGCNACYIQVNQLLDKEIIPEWSIFIGLQNNPSLALQFFSLTRDLFYSRITPGNITHDFIRNLIYEVKEVSQNLRKKNGARL